MTTWARAFDPVETGVYGPVQVSSPHAVTATVPLSRPLVSITLCAVGHDPHTPATRIKTVTAPIAASRPKFRAAKAPGEVEAAGDMAGIIGHTCTPSQLTAGAGGLSATPVHP
jgi:hypothetical protein